MTMKIPLPVKGLIGMSLLSIGVSGCMSAAEHAEQLPSHAEREMTVGLVQKDIRKGMSKTEVAEVLGTPNIIDGDKQGIETWIYDKIASEVSYSRDEAHSGIIGLIIGGGSREAGASASTQKTLTVIIKFKEDVVHEFSYRSSKF